MKFTICVLLILMSQFPPAFSQNNSTRDTTLNNLQLPPGYHTSSYGSIPNYTKLGEGRVQMVLIPGLGFNEEVFRDFAERNKKNYTMYCMTIPGYGSSGAAPAPDGATSFGDQYWNRGVIDGIAKLIASEKILKPIVVGHFTQGTQLALRIAIDFPDLVGGVIILGGPAKFVGVQNGQVQTYPLDKVTRYVDQVSAPTFYRYVSEKYWDANNYPPVLYSLNPELGQQLWQKVADVPMPVIIRYLCEFHASDITLELSKITCNVLVLRPGFTATMLSDPTNPNLNYIKPQFIDSWEGASGLNPLIEIKDVTNSSVFMWKDQPEAVNRLIREFVNRNLNK